jgi:hypothetical protein
MLAGFTQSASATTAFRPRVGNALGLVPSAAYQGSLASGAGALTPVTYHGGGVMNGGVEVHLIFWAPAGYAFQGSPGGGVPSYEGMVERYYTDVAADSGPTSPSLCSTPTGECNVFSTLNQYGSQSSGGAVTPGDYSISFNAASPNDVILDTNPYPTQKCTSPGDTKACILDTQVQQEVDAIASTHGNHRGLTNLWYVFTPPDVDECISPGVCETTLFGGYHSLTDINGHGLTIYAYTGDPIVETRRVNNPGDDPNGNPDAELVVDIVAHETNEAMTDPEGVGWMDPNGFEVGDKCETGPQFGTPLGFAADGSPYNQVINAHQYLTQEMWSNDGGQGNANQNCVQGTTTTTSELPLPQVNLTQFSKTVSGNIGHATSGVGVQVALLRGAAGTQVAQSSTSTAADGSWTVTLGHPVGDDRDEIDVVYSGVGAPTPGHQVILTGNGGNPFVEGGWTGWTALDQGAALTNSDPVTSNPSLTIGSCFQTGVEAYTIAGTPGAESPTDFCQASDVSDTALAAPVTNGQVVTYSTNDNRAFQPPDATFPNGAGGLVNMSLQIGEPDSVAAFPGGLPGFTPTGFDTCSADLGVQQVTCTGLVPTDTYTIKDGSESVSGVADGTGTVSEPLAIDRGDTITLSNSAPRVLTTLHVANLQVHITGGGSTVATGSCSPLQYWGGPLTTPPTNLSAGEPSAVAGGAALTGQICPASGKSDGLPTSSIGQTDELSGGQTVTEVADVADTSPIEGETMYGSFTAIAEATDGSSPITLTIKQGTKTVSGPSSNVDTANGITVSGLPNGSYQAIWTVSNPNGDTRTETTRFIQASALIGPPGKTGPPGPRGPQGPPGPKPKITCKLVKHHDIKCTVTFPKPANDKGTLRVALASGRRIVALGHGRLRHGSATLTMRALHRITAGRLTMTLVISRARRTAITERTSVRIR